MHTTTTCNPNEGCLIFDEPPAAKLANHDPSAINEADPDPDPEPELDPCPDPPVIPGAVVGVSIDAFWLHHKEKCHISRRPKL